MRYPLLAIAATLAFTAIPTLAHALPPTRRQVDVCVYGGTAAGVAAAAQAARDGRVVALLEPGLHLGGMTSGGLGQTDIGNKGAIGGIAREFYKRLGNRYGKDESWVFEPHAAEDVLYEMLNESGVAILLKQPLRSVTKQGGAILEITTEGGFAIQAAIFIDATYEGDLMAAAGVGYHIGRESNATYGETLNGIRANTPKHQLIFPVDPRKTPGDPASGLVPLVQPLPAGVHGEGDRTVQAYNFRMVLTQNPENQREILPPANYDPARFELLARYVQAWSESGKPLSLGQLMHIQPMPGGKTDINNNGGVSTDHIGANYDYPDGNRATRAKIWRDHEDYTRGFFHFLATDSRIPEKIRAEMRSWGLTKDEFIDTKGWPHQLYVREARRMVSDYVMTEHNCAQSIQVPDAIGLAAYTMDSHNCRRIVRDGRVENEGDVQVGGFPPYPIAYRSIVPKRSECSNLLVPVCLSASHIAYGSIRMEPVFMVLGHAAATAAGLAIDGQSSVQEVSIPALQAKLLAQKQILAWDPSLNPSPKKVAHIAPETLPGITLDDTASVHAGYWPASANPEARLVGDGYVHDGNFEKGAQTLSFTPEIPKAGEYDLYLVAPTHPNRATNIPATVQVDGKTIHRATLNQRDPATKGFQPIGRVTLPAGKSTTIIISNAQTDGYVVVDGLQLLPR